MNGRSWSSHKIHGQLWRLIPITSGLYTGNTLFNTISLPCRHRKSSSTTLLSFFSLLQKHSDQSYNWIKSAGSLALFTATRSLRSILCHRRPSQHPRYLQAWRMILLSPNPLLKLVRRLDNFEIVALLTHIRE